MANIRKEYTVRELIELLSDYPSEAIIVVPQSFNTLYGTASWTDQVWVRGTYSSWEIALHQGREVDEVQIGSMPE